MFPAWAGNICLIFLERRNVSIISDKVWSFFGPFRWRSSVLFPLGFSLGFYIGFLFQKLQKHQTFLSLFIGAGRINLYANEEKHQKDMNMVFQCQP